MDLEASRSEGNYRKILAKYANPFVLILDEWLLLKPNEAEQKDMLELIHKRRKKSSTIFCSQYEFEEWYDQLGGVDSPLSEEERKLKETFLLKDIRAKSQVSAIDLMQSLDTEIVDKIKKKRDVIEFIINNGKNEKIIHWLRK